MKRRSLGVLLALALALLLGIGSLAGSTVAWFTDSVTSLNTIQSGKLDVELYYSKTGAEDDWHPVDPEKPVFSEIQKMCVPGQLELVFLRAANEGSLALKYQLGLTAINSKVGKNAAGEDIRMTDHLLVGAWLLNAETQLTYADFDTREEVLAKIAPQNGVSRMQKLKDYEAITLENDAAVGEEEKQLPAAVLLNDRVLPAKAAPVDGQPAVKSTEEIALVVYLPLEEVGNEANYRNSENPEVTVGIHLLAGQAVKETDSFGNTYDVEANYPDYSSPLEVKARLEQDGLSLAEANAESGIQQEQSENAAASPEAGNAGDLPQA